MANFESKLEGAVDGAAAAVFSSPIEPAQIAKKAEKQMKKEKLVGSGRQYAPTLYNVLVNERDDRRLFGFYPTMASEIENYLYARGTEAGMEFDIRPLVRFIPDPGLKKGRFDVIAEVVAAPIIKKLRAEELEYYGLAPEQSAGEAARGASAPVNAVAGNLRGAEPSDRTGKGRPSAPAAARSAAASSRAHPASGRFVGLDVPARIDDLPSPLDALPPLPDALSSSSALPPLSRGRAALDGLPGLTALPSPAVAEPEAFPALGQATLYNASEQRSHRLEQRKLTLGRGRENDITIADANASRIHLRLSQDATGRWKLVDLDSTNGTILNGRPVSSAILRSGDEITIGTTVLQFGE
jgi:hypothetical protein